MDRHGGKHLTRRDFLRIAAGASAGIAVGGVGMLGSVGCAPQSSQTQTPQPQASAAATVANAVVTFSVGTDMRSIDPWADNSRQAKCIARNYYDPLLYWPGSQGFPVLATSWKRVSDTVWEFKLRENVKFHNGQPFGAADVKFTFDRAKDPALKLQAAQALGTVDHTDVVDPTTVRVVTKTSDPLLPQRLDSMGILPGETYKDPKSDEINRKPIGTGPFKVVEWVRDDHLTLEANPDYWGGRPKIAKLIHKPILEAATRVAALRTGAVDLVADVAEQQVAEIEADPNLAAVRVNNARVYLVGLNSFRKPFTDVRVRQAMNYAVDVDTIVKELWGGHAARTPSIIGSDWFGYDPQQKPYPFDPAKAKALLAEAGYPNGFEVTFNTPRGRYPLDAETAQAVSSYLEKVGVKAKVEVMEYGNYLEHLFDPKNPDNRLTMFYIGYWGRDIDDMFSAYLDSKRRGYYYNDPKLDSFINKGLATDKPEERKAIYREALAHVSDAAPWIFLFTGQNVYGVNKRLVGWKAGSDEIVDMAQVSVLN